MNVKRTNIKNGPSIKIRGEDKKENRRCCGTGGTEQIDSRAAGIKLFRRRAPSGHVLILMKRQSSSGRKGMPKFEQTYFILHTERVQDLFSISLYRPLNPPLASSDCRLFTKSFLSRLLQTNRQINEQETSTLVFNIYYTIYLSIISLTSHSIQYFLNSFHILIPFQIIELFKA